MPGYSGPDGLIFLMGHRWLFHLSPVINETSPGLENACGWQWARFLFSAVLDLGKTVHFSVPRFIHPQ